MRRLAVVIAVAGAVAAGTHVGDARAVVGPAPVTLGTAGSFGVLAGTAVTSGVSAVEGDVGAETAITGFPPSTLTGTLDSGNPAAAAAHAALATAYADAVGHSPTEPPITTDLGSQTLTPGVYAATAGITLGAATTVTLDAQGNPAAVFVIQAGSTLTTGAFSNVDLVGGAQACNVFWQVGSSATLGASSLLVGTILASTAITMGDDATLDGRALARDAAVTMTTDTINAAPCTAAVASTTPPITAFSTQLTGLNQTVNTGVGAWSVTDARQSNAGYSVTVAASQPTVNTSPSAAGTGASITLTPGTATPANFNPPSTAPVAKSPQLLSATPTTIENASAGTRQGEWDFPADSAADPSLAIVIPGNSTTGTYEDTLTFTIAPPAS